MCVCVHLALKWYDIISNYNKGYSPSIAPKVHVQLKALPLRALIHWKKSGVGRRWTADGARSGLDQAQGHLENREMAGQFQADQTWGFNFVCLYHNQIWGDGFMGDGTRNSMGYEILMGYEIGIHPNIWAILVDKMGFF